MAKPILIDMAKLTKVLNTWAEERGIQKKFSVMQERKEITFYVNAHDVTINSRGKITGEGVCLVN